ncbi:MAG: flagellar basal body L-ring protein FlgH [Piscirickettsiaceae bacterium]|nr:flagellar basal body L-ring protein FlgH [Piscirickettsiaceae bacterium]
MEKIIKLLILCSLMILTGCVSNEAKRDPAYAAVRPVAVEQQENTDGAIFDIATNISLFEDYRARRVGDILMVKLEEETEAEKETETIVKKSNSNSITNPTVFGTTPEFDLPSVLPLASNHNNNLAFSLGSTHDFKGQGDSDQSNELTGEISVSVVEVLPNGNMIIRGEKVITINQGNEYIRLSGIISPRDIDANNTISSKRVADAQIAYVGDGPTNDANVTGWLSRFFLSALMPF